MSNDSSDSRRGFELPVGEQLILLLRSGRTIQGDVLAAHGGNVQLRLSSSDVRTIPAAWITDWQVVTPDSSVRQVSNAPLYTPSSISHAPASENQEVPKRTIGIQDQIDAVYPTLAAPQQSASTPNGSLVRDAQPSTVAARFLAACRTAASEPLVLRAIETNLGLATRLDYDDRTVVTRILGDLNNYWRYAKKTKEPQRLSAALRQLEVAEEDFPGLAILSYNHGCFLKELGKDDAALAAFMRGAVHGNAGSLYNLGALAVAANRPELAWTAFEILFRRSRASENPAAWRRWISLSVAQGSLGAAADRIQLHLNAAVDEETHELADATAWLLAEQGKFDVAAEILDVKKSITNPQLRDRLRSALRGFAVPGHPLAAHTDPTAIALASGRLLTEHMISSATARSTSIKRPVTGGEGRRRTDTSVAPRAEGIGAARRSNKRNTFAWQGREAELRGDLERAEALYKDAIRAKSNWEFAAKNLAMLLMRLDRHKEAIDLLELHLAAFSNRRPAQQILWNLYREIGEYDHAVRLIHTLIPGSAQLEKIRLYKNLAYCQLKAAQFDDAEQTLVLLLAEQPDDVVSQRFLEQVRAAKAVGPTDSAEIAESFRTLVGLTDFDNPQSEFLSFQLERCDYFGVSATRLVKRDFTFADVNDVERQISGHVSEHGRKQPRPLARLNLTGARLLVDLGEEVSNRVNGFLRNYCATVADAFVSEGKNFDIARSFYAESFAIDAAWNQQAENVLNKYIMSYFDSAVNLLNTTRGVEDSFARALRDTHTTESLVRGLLSLSVASRELTEFLITRVIFVNDERCVRETARACLDFLEEAAPGSFAPENTGAFAALWNRGRERARSEQLTNSTALKALRASNFTFDLLEDQLDRIDAIAGRLVFKLDQDRASEIHHILDLAIQYGRQTEYGEQENAQKVARSRCENLISQIEDGPSKISIEHFRPYLLQLDAFLSNHFEQVQAAAEPEISVSLASDEYYPNENATIACQINLSNAKGKSPASSVAIVVQPSPAGEYEAELQTIVLRESLRGGASITAEVPVVIRDHVNRAQVFTLYYGLRYTTRSAQEIVLHNQSISIPLYPASSFRPFANPYQRYAGGSPVREKGMLFGRDEYIRELVGALSTETTSISHVIYGQMRSGKSSILFRLMEELSYPFVPILFSIADLRSDLQEGKHLSVFTYDIVRRVDDALRAHSRTRGLMDRVTPPKYDEFRERAQSSLAQYFASLSTVLRDEPEIEPPHVVLLIDEFTELYKAILADDLPETFMTYWKALRERSYFSCVMVAQDYFPKFRNRYPNEFQVSTPKRVGYLSHADTKRLVEEPIRIPFDDPHRPGESRFQGAAGQAAIDRLYELTAGNPFYLQGLCDRLVRYMNEPSHQAVLATDVYVEHVKRQAIGLGAVEESSQPLAETYFDNLLRSGDPSADAISRDDAKEVLKVIARESRNQDDCPEQRIASAETSAPVRKILDDLLLRDVIIETRPGHFRLKVGLFKEWLTERL